jgi:hypothetical protein
MIWINVKTYLIGPITVLMNVYKNQMYKVHQNVCT